MAVTRGGLITGTAAAAAVARPQTGPDGMPYVSLPYLVVVKLRAGRAQDVADVSRMLGQADDAALGEVRRAVAAHVPDAVADVERLIALGRLELADA